MKFPIQIRNVLIQVLFILLICLKIFDRNVSAVLDGTSDLIMALILVGIVQSFL